MLTAGARAAAAAALLGLATVTICVVVGWIAAPHVGFGLSGVLRAAAVIWLAGHHVAITVRRAGRIGMLPLGLAGPPGVLLWRAGRAVVKHLGDREPAHVVGIAFAVAAPYSVFAGLLAAISRSTFASASVPWAVLAGFAVAFVAAGFGAARALAPWARLAEAIPAPVRSVLAGAAGSLAVLAAAGCLVTAMALASHVRLFSAVYAMLGPGLVGGVLLLIVQLAYLPNAVIWAICYMLGPGFAVGARTIVAPTGSVLAGVPAFPLLAALPDGPQGSGPGWLAGVMLAVPYLAGLVGGVIVARTSRRTGMEAAPIRGSARVPPPLSRSRSSPCSPAARWVTAGSRLSGRPPGRQAWSRCWNSVSRPLSLRASPTGDPSGTDGSPSAPQPAPAGSVRSGDRFSTGTIRT